MKTAQFPASDAGLHPELLTAGYHCSSQMASCRVDDDDGTAFPPPPPDQLLNQQHVATADSDDEFPLPPPPDQEVVTLQRIGQAVRPADQPNRQPTLMQSLSMKLAERGPVQMRPGPPPVAAKQYRMTMAEQQQQQPVSHAAAAAGLNQSSSGTNMLSQIQRGVSLRRAVSNDRSAPRIPGKR